MSKIKKPFDLEKAVAEYRRTIALRDSAKDQTARAICDSTAATMRQEWKQWQGEDSLHEMAFGEPVD